jgi:cytosine deaminase
LNIIPAIPLPVKIYRSDGRHFPAGDDCLLQELFHPMRTSGDVDSRYSIAHAIVPISQATRPHRLVDISEGYYILQGAGLMHVNDEAEAVSEGMFIFIPPGAVQWIENTGKTDLIFLAICDPFWMESNEITDSKNLQVHLPGDHIRFMQEAIREAIVGEEEGGIPIGSVLVRDGKIIGRGHNRRVQEDDPMMHAEIACLRSAGEPPCIPP